MAATKGKAGLEGPNCASTGSEAFEVGIYAEWPLRGRF